MLDKLEAIYHKFISIEERLSDPEVIGDPKAYAKLHKEYKGLQKLVDAYKAYKNLSDKIDTANEMLQDSDPEMKEMAKEELQILEPKKASMEEEIKVLLIPKIHNG